jgi:prephenate dehydrogenase
VTHALAPLRRVGIVGAGLIGTSVGLALSAVGVDVYFRDRDAEAVRLATALGAGTVWEPGQRVEHAVLAVPPHAVAAALAELQHAGETESASDVASVKVTPVAEAATLGCDLTTFCPAHPVAGRERGGAVSARADLFRDRTWVLCPTERTSAAALEAARFVAESCGATVVETTPERHDRAMAVLSHVPQVAASALAALAAQLPSDDLLFAGPGFRDTTRIADSDPALWASILEGNREPVAEGLERLAQRLSTVSMVLRSGGSAEVAVAVAEVMRTGHVARQQLPAKAGQPVTDWVWVGVVVPDRPGELAALFQAVADWEVNVEDVRVEHSRDHPYGVLELAVRPVVAPDLQARLTDKGWTAYRRD